MLAETKFVEGLLTELVLVADLFVEAIAWSFGGASRSDVEAVAVEATAGVAVVILMELVFIG